MDTEPTPERWITHREAAELWGIKVDSARLKLTRYARERGWEVKTDNSGKKSYRVPEHYDLPTRAPDEPSPEPSPEASPEQSPDQAREISQLVETVASLTEQLGRANAELSGVRSELDAERRKGAWQKLKEAWRGRRRGGDGDIREA